jgi:uncharacterized protein (TIGR02145 family)
MKMNYSIYNMKALFLVLLFSCSFTFCFGQQNTPKNPQNDSGKNRVAPDFFHIPYSTEKHNILNIYIAKGTKNGPPTPLYVWAHGGGGSRLHTFDPDLWNRLSQSGISAISWGSVDTADSPGEYGLKSRDDFEKVMHFVISNADKYNFDINKIVVGGTSRGSFITWEFSHKNPELVKGIYSTGALGEPVMWRDDLTFLTARDPRDEINPNSPPVLFAYPAHLGDVNIHNPRSGLLIKARYDELGIGHRARVEHSLNNRNPRWSFIVDFILEVTDEKFSKEIELDTIRIGDQIWMTKNLNVGYFRNGDIIPQAKTAKEWEDAGASGKPAWCYYNNDPLMEEIFGKLYNLPAVNDPRGLAPEGWEIPAEKQWKELVDFLGGELAAGNKLKSTTGWKNNGNGDNNAGFTALPGGNRNADGSFWLEGEYGYWWGTGTSGSGGIPGALGHIRVMNYYSNTIHGDLGSGISGLSVRCIKNTKTQ